MNEIENKGGLIKGKLHSEGGEPFTVVETNQKIEAERDEPVIPKEAIDDKDKKSYKNMTNKQVLNKINKDVGAKGMNEKATQLHAGDVIICRNAYYDETKKDFEGTDKQIVSAINEDAGCNTIESGGKIIQGGKVKQYAKGGKINIQENDKRKFAKIGIDDIYDLYAMQLIGLSGVKFTKEGVLEKIREEFEKMTSDVSQYAVSEDSPSITNVILNEASTLEQQGAPQSQVDQVKGYVDNSAQREYILNEYKITQNNELRSWITYLKETQEHYSYGFRYSLFHTITKYDYDLKRDKITKRTNKTLRNFTVFDASVVAELHASQSTNLITDYAKIQLKNVENQLNAKSVASTGEGEWLKFEGGSGVKAETIEKNSIALASLVQDTYWCTKTNAKSQLEGGDFYVYVTKKEDGTVSPRIAVRMDNDQVAEVRGNKSSAQDLEEEMIPVAEKFLRDEIKNDSGKKWLDSIAYNKKAIKFYEKIKNEGIGYYKDFFNEFTDLVKDEQKFTVDYAGTNGHVDKVRRLVYEKFEKGNINWQKFGVPMDEVVFNDIHSLSQNKYARIVIQMGRNLLINNGNVDYFLTQQQLEYIWCDNIYLYSKHPISLGKKITVIAKNEMIVYEDVKTLGLIEKVYARKLTIWFEHTLEDFGELVEVGGDLIINHTEKFTMNSLGKIKSIYGNLNFSNRRLKSLGELEYVGGEVQGLVEHSDTILKDLGKIKHLNLQEWGYDSLPSSIENLDYLESVSGKLDLTSVTRFSEIPNLKVADNIDLRKNQHILSLPKLEYVSGNFNARDSKLENLPNLKEVGQFFSLSDHLTELPNLESVYSMQVHLDARLSPNFPKLKHAGFITIAVNEEGDGERNEIKISAPNLVSADDVHIIGNATSINLPKLETINGAFTWTHTFAMHINYGSVDTFKNIKYVGGEFDIRYNLRINNLGSLEKIEGNADFTRTRVKELPSLKFIGGDAKFEHSQINNFQNLEIIGGSLLSISHNTDTFGKLKSINGMLFEGEDKDYKILEFLFNTNVLELYEYEAIKENFDRYRQKKQKEYIVNKISKLTQMIKAGADSLPKHEVDFVNKIIEDAKRGVKYGRRTAVEKIAKSYGIEDKTDVKELTELSIVLLAREIAHKPDYTIEEKYNEIVQLYENQTNLSLRTTQSILYQQYSTPAPIGFLAGLFCGFDKGGEFFEPSAGNGLLTITGKPEDFTVNEVDDRRFDNLKHQAYKRVTDYDASLRFYQYYHEFDGVITNPPFGTYHKTVEFDGYKFKALDMIMAIRALNTMKDEGRCAIIIGGHTQFDEMGRIQNGKNRVFFSYLYEYYYVRDVINISGHDLYRKQGTAFPTRLILIDGRKEKKGGLPFFRNDELAENQTMSQKPVTTFSTLFERVMNVLK